MAIPESLPVAPVNVVEVDPKITDALNLPSDKGESIPLADLNIRALKNLASGRIRNYNVLSKAQLLTGLEDFDISAHEVEAAIASAEEAQAKDAESKRKKRLEKQSGGNTHGDN